MMYYLVTRVLEACCLAIDQTLLKYATCQFMKVKVSAGRLFKTADPLIIHDVPELDKNDESSTDEEQPEKTSELLHGLRAVKDCVFHPSRLSLNGCSKGNVQTLLSKFREWYNGHPF